MNGLPTGWLGTAFLLWGWEHGQWGLAVLLAVGLEWLPLLSWEQQLEPRHYARVVDLCSLIFSFFAVWIVLKSGFLGLLLPLLQWLPLLLLPLILVMILGQASSLPASVFFYSLRRKTGEQPKIAKERIVSIYGLLVVLAAGARPPGDWYFFPMVVVLAAWWLWPRRRHRIWPWLGMLILGGGGGYLIQDGLTHLQVMVQERTAEWLSQQGLMGEVDSYRQGTAIGDMSRLKDSGRIIMHVLWRGSSSILLRKASYTIWQGKNWYAPSPTWQPMAMAALSGEWLWPPPRPGRSELTIRQETAGHQHLLALPMGTTRIRGLTATGMLWTGMGAVKAKDPPSIADYSVRFDPDLPTDPAPGPGDLNIPSKEIPALDQVIKELGPLPGDPWLQVAHVRRFFQDRFRYSLVLTRQDQSLTPIADFLLQTRSGHCEYFATATALLLRRLGIPSRYTLGYLVQEEENGPMGHFLVRQRHAHAWVLAYAGGRWREVDTTPMGWPDLEADPPWQFLWDWLSNRHLDLLTWQRDATEAERQRLAWMVLAGLVAWLGWRWRGRMAWKAFRPRRRRPSTRSLPVVKEGPMDPVIKTLESRHGPRPAGEPLRRWVRRVGEDSLEALLVLYYGYRYDPGQVQPEPTLTEGVTLWLRDHDKGKKT